MLVGFLTGIPRTGHITFGLLCERDGTVLVEELRCLAHAAGAVVASVVLDSV